MSKPTGTDNAYFTIGMLPAPLSIPCELALDFAKFKEVTVTNSSLLADMLTEFQLALVAAGKSGAVAVYPPLVLDFHSIFVTCSVMALTLFSVEPLCLPSYEPHVLDLFYACFSFCSCADVLEIELCFVFVLLKQYPPALTFCPYHPRQSYYATHRPSLH